MRDMRASDARGVLEKARAAGMEATRDVARKVEDSIVGIGAWAW